MKFKFNLGGVYVTNGVDAMAQEDDEFNQFIWNSLERHANGDWGDLCDEDKEMNELALKSGEDRLFSKYKFNGDVSIYIITEWDRTLTTILFPDEY